MPGIVPREPKIYHIVHVDRLESIVQEGCLWSDAEARERNLPGTLIGDPNIKDQRLRRALTSHHGLHVGECACFLFGPRSVLLYILNKGDRPNLPYTGGQDLLVHLQADFYKVVAWADAHGRRWAFTDRNAALAYAADYCEAGELHAIDWDAVRTRNFAPGTREENKALQEKKAAEFLIESSLPMHLFEIIGVSSLRVRDRVRSIMEGSGHCPVVKVMPGWYYSQGGRA